MTGTTVSAGSRALAELVDSLAAADPKWLRELRRDAWRRFEELPLPPRAEHLWRYTDPAKLLPADRTPQQIATHFGELPADFHDGIFENAAGYAVCRDGTLLKSSVDPLIADAGVVVEDLREAARRRPELVRQHLFALAEPGPGGGAKFDALSAALFTGGTFVHVPPGKELSLPLRVASRVGGAGLLASRSLVVVGAGAKATLVFDLASDDDACTPLLHETTEVFVGAGASVRIVHVQTLSRGAVYAPILRARIDRDARIETVTVALGGALTKSLEAATLAGPGASARVLGIVFADGRRHFDHHTFEDHAAPHTTSDLDYRAVVADHARSVCTGRLRITKDGTGADAHQRNHNLLLSDSARADAIPELEILTDDVKCSHAAAVGPIDEEQVFFCQSRGLSRAEARRTIVMGFLEPALAAVPGDKLAARVRKAVDRRLAEMQ